MRLLQLSDAVADACGVPTGRIKSILRRFQDAGIFPKGQGGSNAAPGDVLHAATLIVAELSNAAGPRVVDITLAYSSFKFGDLRAGALIAGVLAQGISDDDPEAIETLRSCSVTVYRGNIPAVVVRYRQAECVVEHVFTPEGEPWAPEDAVGVVRSATMSGNGLLHLATVMRCTP